MLTKRSNTQKLIIGLIIGGILAGTSTALLTSRRARRLRRDIRNTYQSVRARIGEVVDDFSNRSYNVLENVNGNPGTWAQNAKHIARKVIRGLQSVVDLQEEGVRSGLLIGGIIGGLLGIGGAVMLIRSQESKSTFKNILSQASNIKGVINDINEVLQNINERPRQTRLFARNPNRLNEILDFAAAGVQLWQNVKRKKAQLVA